MIKKIVISLGGSVINPNRFRLRFLEKLALLSAEYALNAQLYFICGGGYRARRHMRSEKTTEGKDIAGILGTWENAEDVRKVFDIVLPTYPYILKAPKKVPTRYKAVIAGGWKPGFSTDAVAVEFARLVGAKAVLNVSNIDYLYSKDPKLKGAKPLGKVTWDHFFRIIGTKRVPGGNYPFDPVAAKKAAELGLAVIIINGNKFWRIKSAFADKYLGSMIYDVRN
jgi:uridylate kinase